MSVSVCLWSNSQSAYDLYDMYGSVYDSEFMLFAEEVEVCIELSLKMLKPREIEFSNKLREADDGIIHIRCNIGNYFILLLSAVNIINVKCLTTETANYSNSESINDIII